MKQALLKARSMWIEGRHLNSCFADEAIRQQGYRLMQQAKRIVRRLGYQPQAVLP